VPNPDSHQPQRLSVRVSINGGAVSGVTSPHHSISVSGTERVIVTTQSTAVAPQHDFELAWAQYPGK
jgi:hypothetical protein